MAPLFVWCETLMSVGLLTDLKAVTEGPIAAKIKALNDASAAKRA